MTVFRLSIPAGKGSPEMDLPSRPTVVCRCFLMADNTYTPASLPAKGNARCFTTGA